jgi:transposase
MYRVTLTAEELSELNRLCHDKDTKPKTRTRLEMVRLSNAGWTIPQIAHHFDLTESRMRHWIKAFLADGFDALKSKQSPGPPIKVTPIVVASLKAMLSTTDQTWTAPQLQDWLEENHGISLNRSWLSEVLVKNGISYKRTTRTLRHKQDPAQVADKKADLETLKKGQRSG